MLGGRDVFRRGVLDERRAARAARAQARRVRPRREDGAQRAGFKKELIVAERRAGSRSSSRGLEWKPGAIEWSGYEATTSYTRPTPGARRSSSARSSHAREWGLVWDIGCNEGRYSRIAAENARYVVAMDGDAAVVDRLYRALRERATTRSCRSSSTSTDPSPALGWRGLERRTLDDARQARADALPRASCTTSRSAATCPCRSSSPGSPSSGRRS